MSTIASVPPHVVLSDVDATADVTKSAVDVSSDATVAPSVNIEQPNEPTMTEHLYRYKVQMTCGGCSGAVTRVLTKAKDSGAGVNSFSVSLENQSVEVRGPIEFEDLTSKIEKTGKKILEKEEVIDTPSEVLAVPDIEPVAPAVSVA